MSFQSADYSEKGFNRKKSIGDISTTSRKSHMYTMVALEHALKWNVGPLQKFAALNDFSGENISFLNHLAHWKKGWMKQEHEKYTFKLPSERQPENKSEQKLRQQFNRVLRIYAAFLSSEHAKFLINICSRNLSQLDDIFTGRAQVMYGDTGSKGTYNSATPCEDFPKGGARVDAQAQVPPNSADSFGSDDLWYWGNVPESFPAAVFDDAESEIKHLILRNTWPKFVNAGLAEQISSGGGNGLGRRLSEYFYRGGGGPRK